MRMTMLVAGAAAATLLLASPASAQDASGELHCNIQGGFGFIIGGSRAVSCTYRRAGLPVEFYTGSTGNIGLDIGPTNAVVATYRVSATPAAPGVLQGDFAGPGFGIAGGAGIAANALIGGSGVTLIPVPNNATTAYTGLNISGGINQLHLQFAGLEEVPDRNRRRRILKSYGLEDGTN
ncbi:DUF992 domain-containing protein [Beijerinckia sp. L45]|uniref:DUF992 domain-containing protein n=1 Tax=Beijerinckia sp. L45 TaxID=1641855 RepID=UPI00131E4824|nr:DUF992 domain-containing protein [Beijerinckia sp. L45]